MYKYLKSLATWGVLQDPNDIPLQTFDESVVSLADATTLRQAARGSGVLMGTAMNYWHLDESSKFYNKQYADLAAREYNVITAEGSCKMIAIAKGWNDFNFRGCDGVKDYAKKHGMQMRGHNLIWGKNGDWFPDFVRKEKNVKKLEQFMENFIKTTVKHMEGYPYAWDVINEPIADDGPNPRLRTDHPFAKVPDYICKSLKWAHEADPKAKLFINDYSIVSAENWSKKKSDFMYNMIVDLKKRGCPIHGVGMQSHLTTHYYYMDMWDGIHKNMQRYHDIGIDVHITEIDVRCDDRDKSCSWNKAAKTLQANNFGKMLNICLNEPACKAFVSWGFTDLVYHMKTRQALPFDKKL